jgi:rod shape-determining protein MreC
VFTVHKKQLIRIFFGFVALWVAVRAGSTLEAPLLDILRRPLNLLTGFRHEAGALIFYHRNYLDQRALRRENELLRKRLIEYGEVAAENERMRALLAFKEQSSFPLLGAKVTGFSSDSWSSVIIIDRGKKSGVKKSDVVVSYLGLVGRVIESAEQTSKVQLISDPSFGVSAFVQRSRQEGLVSGTLGNLLVMKYLPKDADIQPGDVVLTSGMTELFPKGIAVGTVQEVGMELSGLSRYATIRPAAPLSYLEEVLVIIGQ